MKSNRIFRLHWRADDDLRLQEGKRAQRRASNFLAPGSGRFMVFVLWFVMISQAISTVTYIAQLKKLNMLSWQRMAGPAVGVTSILIVACLLYCASDRRSRWKSWAADAAAVLALGQLAYFAFLIGIGQGAGVLSPCTLGPPLIAASCIKDLMTRLFFPAKGVNPVARPAGVRQSLRVSALGVAMRRGQNWFAWRWSAFRKIEVAKSYIHLAVSEDFSLVIPRDAFSGIDEEAAFRQLCAARIGA